MDLDIVWIVKSDCKYIFPKEIRTVEIGTAKYYRELATAKVWVDNVRKDFHIRKRKRQYYIQTWHGLVPFKKIEKDTQSTLSDNYIKCAKNDSQMADIITSGCRERTTLIRRAFWYDGVIIEKGSPRSDIFFKHNSCKEKVYNKLCISLDKRLFCMFRHLETVIQQIC